MNEDVKITQELVAVDAPTACDPEKPLQQAGCIIDSMMHALGGGRLNRNRYEILACAGGVKNWWLLVGLGLAKKESDFEVDGVGFLVFSVTWQGIAYLKSIGAFTKGAKL